MEGERRDGERTPHCEIKLYCGNTVTHLTLRDKIILGEYSYDYCMLFKTNYVFQSLVLKFLNTFWRSLVLFGKAEERKIFISSTTYSPGFQLMNIANMD